MLLRLLKDSRSPALLLLSLFLVSNPARSSEEKADLLILGDSQTGAVWASSYFGDFFQACLKQHSGNLNFEVYARGGTQPIHWLSHPGLDHIPTLHRNRSQPSENLGGADAPSSFKRLESLLKLHQPARVLLFFGDNLLKSSDAEITRQYQNLLKVLKSSGITGESCILLTPTFEMEVRDRRNVPSKTVLQTKRISALIRSTVGSECRVIDGLSLMSGSALRQGDLLSRRLVPGTSGCSGPASNDNIHLCGQAAQDFARRVCSEI